MKSKPNYKVVFYSLLALGFIALTFLVDWLFIIGAVALTFLNQKELNKNKKINKKKKKGDESLECHPHQMLKHWVVLDKHVKKIQRLRFH